MRKALAVLFLLSLVIIGPMSNVVRAVELEANSKRVNIVPWEGYEAAHNNIASDNFTKEFNILENDIELPNGVYYGPYAESSLFRFERAGGSFDFNSTFNFTYQDIINGCSEMTIRIPLLYEAANYQYANFYIRDEITGNYTTYINIDHDTPYIQIGTYGIYFKNQGLIFPNRTYTIGLTATLTDNASPQLFLTMENYQAANTVLNFWNYENRDEQPGGSYWPELWKYPQGRTVLYDIYEELPGIYPAWAFIFEQGIGENGLFGLKLDFGTTNTNSTFNYPYNQMIIDEAVFPGTQTPTSGFNFSIYIPFKAQDSELVNWKITATVSASGGGTPTQFKNPVGGATADTITFFVNDTREFLLTSCPWYLFGDQDINSINLTLIPDKPLTVLCTLKEYEGDRFATPTPAFRYWDEQNHVFPWQNIHRTNIPLFAVYSFTTGQWASITPRYHSIKYNFGWGRAYRIRGESTFNFFLNNGTNELIRGQISDLANIVNGEEDKRSNWSILFDLIRGIPGNVYGFFKTVYDKVVSLGQWIKHSLMSLADWLMDILGEILEVLTITFKALGLSLTFFAIVVIQTFATGRGKASIQDLKAQGQRLKERGEQFKMHRTTKFFKGEEKKQLAEAKRRHKIQTIQTDEERAKAAVRQQRSSEAGRKIQQRQQAARESQRDHHLIKRRYRK